MQILQGKYLKSIESAKGTLKGIQLKTPEGKRVVEIPKVLRAIAKTEIAIGDELRIWAMPSSKKDRKKSRKSAAKAPQLIACQLIPLSPKAKIAASEAAQQKKKEKTKDKRKGAKKLTVQLCQKKNCCRRGGDELWTAFEAAAQAAKTDAAMREFKLEAVGCLGGCKNGPNIRLLPNNVKHRSVKPSDIKALVASKSA